MTAFIITAAIVLILAAELISRREDLRRLQVDFEADTDLVEPGESVCLRCTVRNPGPLPVLFSDLTLRLPDGIGIDEDELWKQRHLTKDFTGSQVEYRFYLLPHGKFTGRVRLTFSSRGLHELGEWYVECGDLLGLKPSLRTGMVPLRIVCTAPCADAGEFDAVGGLVGDISVRRFINEDPTLIAGYREYTGREPMKDISWLQTAKRGELTVRKKDFTSDRLAVIALCMDETRRRDMEGCLSLTRSVCEQLESGKIPYAVFSNGDVGNVPEGLGRAHLFFIHRRLGLSRLAGHSSFGSVLEKIANERRGDVGVIIIAPSPLEKYSAELRRLRRMLDREPVIIYGGEDRD